MELNNLDEESLVGELLLYSKENYNASNEDEVFNKVHYLVTKEKKLPNNWVLLEFSIIEPNKSSSNFMTNYKIALPEDMHNALLEDGKVCLDRYGDNFIELILR